MTAHYIHATMMELLTLQWKITKVSDLSRWIKFLLFDNLYHHYCDLMTAMTWKVEGSCQYFHFYYTYENQDQGFLFQFWWYWKSGRKFQNFRKLVEFTLKRKIIPKCHNFFLITKIWEKKKRNPVSPTLEVCGCQRWWTKCLMQL
jgi:hypothetical protein